MKMTRLAVLVALSCVVLSACNGEVDPTIARVGAPVLDRVLPGEFEKFAIREGGLGYRDERCAVTITEGHRSGWFANDSGELEIDGPRTDMDSMTLTAVKTDGHWHITDASADPHAMDMKEFETRVTECVNAFEDAHKRWTDEVQKDRARADKNMKSWEAGAPAPASSGA
ncbi:hypothetical protein AB4Y45_33665 [Paraburkholderia sp. EG287A]|uniref:hypothetical protein n=1 Tax=Paraburkholderia sp. EG287A TaxID=3237012 RepID=UPI0034D19FDE